MIEDRVIALARQYLERVLPNSGYDEYDYTRIAKNVLATVHYSELVEAAKAVVQGFGGYQLRPGDGDGKLGYGPYWSPSASMVDTSLIAALEAVLKKV